MRRLFFTFFLLIVIGGAAIPARAQAGAGSPGAVIRNFYAWYITSIDAGKDPMTVGKTTLKKFVTQRLITQVGRDERNGLDADEFLQTQDMDKAWGDAINVSKLSVKATTATAIVTFGEDNYPKLAVSLVKQAGVWRIDRIKDASGR